MCLFHLKSHFAYSHEYVQLPGLSFLQISESPHILYTNDSLKAPYRHKGVLSIADRPHI
jgi:hypothetical protein